MYPSRRFGFEQMGSRYLERGIRTRTDENSVPYLVIQNAGSPLSGANKCCIVKQTGEIEEVFLDRFPATWHTFLRICRRYEHVAYDGNLFTLKQTFLVANQGNEAAKY